MNRNSSQCGDALSGLGAYEHPQGSLGVGALPEESLHLGEGPQEDQVSVHGKHFPSHHQAGHLKTMRCFRQITDSICRESRESQSIRKGFEIESVDKMVTSCAKIKKKVPCEQEDKRPVLLIFLLNNHLRLFHWRLGRKMQIT